MIKPEDKTRPPGVFILSLHAREEQSATNLVSYAGFLAETDGWRSGKDFGGRVG